MKWICVLVLGACGFGRPDLNGTDGNPAMDTGDGGGDAPDVDCSGCRLLAFSPPVANAGDTLTLEGTFIEGMKVTFPGGAKVVATLAGPHRATVVVPDTATTGPLQLSSASSSAPFRRATFELGFEQVQRFETQTTGGRAISQQGTGRRYAPVVTTGSRIHVIGGYVSNGTTVEASVETAVFGPAGLDAFSTATTTLVSARAYAAAVATDRFVYVIGGTFDDISAMTSVERAPIEASGTLGAFEKITDLTQGRMQPSVAVIGDSLYVVGGFDNGPLSSIERATIQADGSLGPFADAGVALVRERNGQLMALVGSQLYVMGGAGPGGVLERTFERASIQEDGSLGAFEIVPGPVLGDFNAAIGPALVLGNSLHITEDQLGATGSGGHVVKRTAVSADGSLSSLSVTGTFDGRACCYATAIAGDQVYLLGGVDESSNATVRTLRGSIARATTLASATRAGSHGNARGFGTGAVAGDRFYEIGGFGLDGASVRSINEATITDGEIGPFVASARSLNTARHRVASAVIEKSIYVIGGANRPTPGSSSTALATIERADVQADGSLGAFSVISSQLVSPRFSHSAIVLGGFLYVLGGASSVERAPITNGSLGAFAVVPGVTTSGQSMRGVAVIRDFVYLFGGGEGSTAVRTIERAPIAADGSLGTFSTLPQQLTTARGAPTIAVVGTSVFVVGGVNGTGTPTTVERAEIFADGTLSSFALVPGVAMSPDRVVPVAAVLGNALWIVGADLVPGQPETVDRMELR